ncbi:hypothetical protein ACVW1C_005890 [Bradyrhizobium sp. USDA 4011]
MIVQIDVAGRQVVVAGSFRDVGSHIDDCPFISLAIIELTVKRVIDGADVDATVISCTGMRAASVVDSIEKHTGKYVITSNQALCWRPCAGMPCALPVTTMPCSDGGDLLRSAS